MPWCSPNPGLGVGLLGRGRRLWDHQGRGLQDLISGACGPGLQLWDSVHTLYLTRRLHVRGGLDRAQFAWPSLLVAGFPAEPACAVRLPCIEQTAAEFCMKYGECPAGQVRPENQTWASTSVVAL